MFKGLLSENNEDTQVEDTHAQSLSDGEPHEIHTQIVNPQIRGQGQRHKSKDMIDFSEPVEPEESDQDIDKLSHSLPEDTGSDHPIEENKHEIFSDINNVGFSHSKQKSH